MNSQDPATLPPGTIEALPSWDAKDPTRGGPVAKIKLGAAEYVLRITRSTKLILTK